MASVALPPPSTHGVCHQVYIPAMEVVWSPPSQGYVKLNFDGGLLRDKSSAISAGIFRDHRGAALSYYAAAKPECTGRSPYDGEANALYLGLEIACRRGYQKLWIEGDAKFLIEVLQERRLNTWYDEGVLDKIRAILGMFPDTPKLTFIQREGNMAADALVKVVHDNPAFIPRPPHGQLPLRVARIADRERRGYVYVRKESTYITGPRCY